MTKREFIPAHNEYVGNTCFQVGSNPCGMSLPQFQWEDDCYHVEFNDSAKDDWGETCLTKEEYAKVKVGDYFTKGQ